MTKTYLFVAGKSGGHIVPALTKAHELKAHENAYIIFVTTDSLLDKSILAQYSWVDQHVIISLGNVPRKIYRYPRFLWEFIKTFFSMIRLMYMHKPNHIVAFGGYPSIPICLAGLLLRISYDLYELNAEPGRAIKFLARGAHKIHICFENTEKYIKHAKCIVTPYPIRFIQEKLLTASDARSILALPEKKTLLILGGSQGSLFLNDLAIKLVQKILQEKKINIIHQTGAQNFSAIKKFYDNSSIPALVFDYRDDMLPCYKAADMVIARAGAGTLFELSFFKKKSIIIPLLTHSTQHQRENAYAMQQTNPELFTVIEQTTIEQMLGQLELLLRN